MSDAGHYAEVLFSFVIITISCLLRLYVRRFIVPLHLEVDDYLIVAALAVSICSTAVSITMVKNGGFDLQTATPEEWVIDLKIVFVLPFFYLLDLWCIKFSLLALYYRVFSQPKLKNYIRLTAVFLGVTLIAGILTQFLFCLPISDNFNILVFVTTWSSRAKRANIVFCVLAVVTDIMLIIIPLQTLPQLRINWKKKCSLIFLFALGSLAIIAALVRCILFVTDATLKQVVLWSGLEQTVSYLAANAPALRPLFFRDSFQRATEYSRSYDAHEMTPKDTVVGAVTVGEVFPVDGVSVHRTVEITVSSEDNFSV